jgi:predicted metal-dependent peptidase
MKFSRVIGKIDQKLVEQAEDRLSKVFLELALKYDNDHVGTGYGGDALIFSLMYPVQHMATLNIPTCGTDGVRYYHNPKFVLKQSIKGLRIICAHEAWHAIYMHPIRRGSRNPSLWNIAVDYIVNGTVMEDLKARKKDAPMEFSKNLGRYMTLPQFCEMIKNPFAKIDGFEDINPKMHDPDAPVVKLPAPDEDRELTPEECAELERREKRVSFFYADPDLPDDMKNPEKIYNLLYNLLPKCPKCGALGMYKLPSKNKKGSKSDQGDDHKDGKGKKKGSGKGDQEGEKNKGKDKHEGHDHGGDEKCDCPHRDQSGDQVDGQGQGNQPGDQGQGGGEQEGPCDHCGGGVDIFGLGGLVDEHLDSTESQEKIAKRISEAMESARKLAGKVPAALEDELGKLTAPVIRWSDVIRCRLLKSRAGNAKNDWTRFRTRPLFTGQLIPRRKSYLSNFGCLLDCSGSMGKNDISFGISQLMGLDDRSEGTVVPCDAECYFSKATKIKKCNAEELTKVKVVGRGGTVFAQFFTDYEKHIGKCDFLIVITDGYLLDQDVAEMVQPPCDVYWVITSGASFKAPFGRTFELHQ